MHVGKRIKEIREASGLMAKYVAKKAGISLWYLSMIENGKRVPSVEKLQTIADVLGVEVARFFLADDVSETLNERQVR
ncbi:helix-turn-helix domain-containing protein [Desulfotruncus alcoholivorax]|uniref:helix-turn-helix domain-containing protein n=1 Tax=Desulfotruncus alcoholivorax TaxID=265477 RepID=UPI001EE55371|nr:helix-turn-helix transcriptional regulator [Desulfotruncus alcoholivorax]